jgi:hypothetical protein
MSRACVFVYGLWGLCVVLHLARNTCKSDDFIKSIGPITWVSGTFGGGTQPCILGSSLKKLTVEDMLVKLASRLEML